MTSIHGILSFPLIPIPDISFFRSNPDPFYALAHELYPGRYKPTISHCFLRLLSDKGLLLKLFTQNIDCLERVVGVPNEKIVEAHGSFATQRCIDCKTPFPDALMKEAIDKSSVPRCQKSSCNGLIKPDIVFFGEALPGDFFQNRTLPSAADLAIIMGTSLTVQPFASLPGFCSEGTPRVLLNLERVGSLGSRADDVILLAECDAGVRKLASALGWLDELEQIWKSTGQENSLRQETTKSERTKHEALENEIIAVTEEIEKSLKVTEDHCTSTKNSLENENQMPEVPRSTKDQDQDHKEPIKENEPIDVTNHDVEVHESSKEILTFKSIENGEERKPGFIQTSSQDRSSL
ncbi:MAG: hypothetical protein Q9190_004875 [Brigantiaea leucoxantha]